MKKLTLLASLLLATSLASTAQTAPYSRTVIVPSTGNTISDGAALITALGNLSPTPSSRNRWLVKLEPGFYDVGTSPVVMREFVDIEGSGILQTIIRGSVASSTGLQGGLVEGADRAEIRQLTINCNSNATQTSCQAMSILNTSPRLRQLRIMVNGTGTSLHWGIRVFNGAPTLDDVDVRVTALGSTDSYGIVYAGDSTANINNSSIVVRDSTDLNTGILLKDRIRYSVIKNSSVTVIGGTSAGAVKYLNVTTAQNILFDNVILSAHGATDESFGIGAPGSVSSGSPWAKVWFRSGRIHGATGAISLPLSTVRLANTEVSTDAGVTNAVSALHVRVGSTWVRGGGSIVGTLSTVCAGVFTDNFTFFPSTCP